mgnify:CR=1 FL=1
MAENKTTPLLTPNGQDQQIREKRAAQALDLRQVLANLSMAQKVALSEVGHYGYDLAFVRATDNGPLAVVMADDKIMTIDNDGEIEPNPNIPIRE